LFSYVDPLFHLCFRTSFWRCTSPPMVRKRVRLQ
jgi:hypothetical protein